MMSNYVLTFLYLVKKNNLKKKINFVHFLPKKMFVQSFTKKKLKKKTYSKNKSIFFYTQFLFLKKYFIK